MYVVLSWLSLVVACLPSPRSARKNDIDIFFSLELPCRKASARIASMTWTVANVGRLTCAVLGAAHFVGWAQAGMSLAEDISKLKPKNPPALRSRGPHP